MLVDMVGAISFGTTFAVAPDVLGQTVEITIGGVPARLELPRVEWEPNARHDRPNLVFPEVPEADSRVVHHWFEGTGEHYQSWGEVNSWTAGQIVKSAGLRRAIAVFPGVVGDDISYSNYLHGRGHPRGGRVVEEVFGAVDDWVNLLREWVGVFTGQSTDPTQPVRSIHARGRSLTLLTIEEDNHSLPGSAPFPFELTIGGDGSDALDLHTLTSACALASDLTRPPIEHLLLSSARVAMRRDELRRAVIDAGTAADLALNQMFSADLGALDPAISAAVLGENRTLGRLASVMSYRNLPSDLNSALDDWFQGVSGRRR